MFSFNSPYGACPDCNGLGTCMHFTEYLVVPDAGLSLREGAIAPWAKSTSPYQTQTLQALAAHYKFDRKKKWKDLPAHVQQLFLYGSGEEVVTFAYDDGMRSYKTKKPFEGVIPNLERRWKETDSSAVREELGKYLVSIPAFKEGTTPRSLADIIAFNKAHADTELRWFGQETFEAANLLEAQFHRCDLNNTDWTRATLASARFAEVKLTGAQFREAQTLGLGFHDSLLVGADLRGISFRKQTIEQLDLSDADVSGCDFRDAIFEGGSLRDAHLKNTRFDGADLRAADLGGLRITALAQFFKGAILSTDQAAALVSGLGIRVV